ncbi:hypothetical protein [Pelagibacterium halotolerans]|uniref:hypothetical protein n=1 Tax=Pelagibacterium halotolerans TaxID=531813 RepID=UPI003850EC78
MFELFQYLHVVSAVIWAGSALAGTLIWLPALVVLEPETIAKYWGALGKRARTVVMWSAIATILTGLARAYLSGRFRSVEDLWTPYGLTVTASFAVFFGMRAYGRNSGKPVMAALRAGADPRPAMRKALPMDTVVHVGGILVLLGFMTAMGVGRV